MAFKAKIIGAGSIGNHLAKACRDSGFEVTVIDRDPAALKRMKEDIYPKRYGAWDEAIKIFSSSEEPRGGFDAILIGTPPDVRMKLALGALKENPKVLQLEKPPCDPGMNGLREFIAEEKKCSTAVIVGFNHLLAKNTKIAEQLINEKNKELGALVSLEAEVRSSWENILKAHPWLKGPEDTYLGFWQKGGGASGEHSHALNLWQHFARLSGAGRIVKVNAVIDYKNNYDRQFFIQVMTENGLVGRIAQDVVTQPKRKWARLQYEKGAIEWHNDVTKTTDEVRFVPAAGEPQIQVIEKTRTEEFLVESEHIRDLVENKISISQSPIQFDWAIEVMPVLAAAHESARLNKSVEVDYKILG